MPAVSRRGFFNGMFGASALMPAYERIINSGAPVAQACGRHATGYSTGTGTSSCTISSHVADRRMARSTADTRPMVQPGARWPTCDCSLPVSPASTHFGPKWKAKFNVGFRSPLRHSNRVRQPGLSVARLISGDRRREIRRLLLAG